MSFIVHRAAKSAARYTDAGGREKCGYCRFFTAPRACGKVIGPVSPAGWCKYFSRQVAQQYSGAGITGGGGPPGATLALDFMSSGNMPAGVTFTRASTATWTDASGVIQTAAVNQPRWDYAGGSLRGLLIEEARTNILLRSADVSNAAWQSAGSPGAAPIVTANQVVAPDGTLTAARVVLPAVSAAGGYSILYQTPTITAVPYAFSVWLRGAVGGEQLYISAISAASGRTRATLTTQWQRFVMLTQSTSAGTAIFEIGCDLRDVAQTSIAAQTVYVWGADAEAGVDATSYIPTTSTAVTRAADIASMPTNASWYSASTYSLFFEVYTGSKLDSVGGGFGDGSVFANAAYLAGQYWSAAGVSCGSGAPYVANTLNKLCGINNNPGLSIKMAMNGQVGPPVTMPSPQPPGTLLSIGSAPWALGSAAFNGRLRGIQCWPRVLSDTELAQVTT